MRDVLGLRAQITALKDNIIKYSTSGIEIDGSEKYIVFLSFGNPEARAYVCRGTGDSILESWDKAAEELDKRVKKLKLKPVWVKADIVTSIKEFTLPEFIRHISQIKINYFREGIAFDKRFKIAFLEQEVNANVFIYENKDKSKKTLVWRNINYYIKRNTGLNLLLGDDVVDKVYTFQTKSAFHDGEKCYPLGNQWLDNGRRCIDVLCPEHLRYIIARSSEYLAGQVMENGQFRYGYFPCFDKEIPHYNILRHASTAYSMIEAYEITRSERLKEAIVRAIEYLVLEGVRVVRNHGVELGFVVEKTDRNSIKLGANAAAVLALTKYTQVFSDQRYLPGLNQLAEGIAFMQTDEGGFVHVLNYPDLSVREVHRIIYYDGEAAFALMRLFGIDRQPRWLKIVEKAFTYFIANNYARYNDHWLSYCSCELFSHRPEQKYLEFNLKNAEGILDFCLTRETTYATLLELLMASQRIIETCKRENLFLEAIAEFDVHKLEAAIKHRAEHQLNGLMFPEVAMYFKVPKNILWAFYIRHHSFRVRIDDVEHNLSGYCSYFHKLYKPKSAT